MNPVAENDLLKCKGITSLPLNWRVTIWILEGWILIDNVQHHSGHMHLILIFTSKGLLYYNCWLKSILLIPMNLRLLYLYIYILLHKINKCDWNPLNCCLFHFTRVFTRVNTTCTTTYFEQCKNHTTTYYLLLTLLNYKKSLHIEYNTAIHSNQ